MGIAKAAATGDRVKALEAMRASLAEAMDEATPAIKAQLATSLLKVLSELAELGAGKKVSGLDELLIRRATRLAASDASKPAKRQTRKRA